MTRRRDLKPAGRNNGIDKKLARYALAGGALLGLPCTAGANTIEYSGILNQSITDGNSYQVLLPGSTSFTIAAQNSGDVNENLVSGSGVTFVDDLSGLPVAMNFGDLITAANATGAGGQLNGVDTTNFPSKAYSGNWPNGGGSAYLGLEFISSGQTYTGWAQIIASTGLSPGSESATLVDYAYNTTPGDSIIAGAGEAPEPSSLVLFALGAAGIVALQRRRAAKR
jgi:hypothetical protein